MLFFICKIITKQTIMDDSDFMRLALDQARSAAEADEVPVGAILVKDGQILAREITAPSGL